jgi:hypothetical protein
MIKKIGAENITLIEQGQIVSDGFIGCFGILGYFKKEGKGVLVLGHHSPTDYMNITSQWANFKHKNPQLNHYDYAKIIIAKQEPEPQGKWIQQDGRLLTYNERLIEVFNTLKVQHPKAIIEVTTYKRDSFFLGNIDNLTWETNKNKGKLK